MARQDDNVAVKIILGVVIGFFALIIFGVGIFFIFSTKNKIAKLEEDKQKLIETQNMANVQTPVPGQVLPDGTVVPNPQQPQQQQTTQQQTTQQTTTKKTTSTKKSNQTIPTRERTLITKSSDLDLVNVRKDPNSKSTIVNELDDNEKVRVTGKNGDWYRVQDSKGNKGYIHKSQLQRNQSKPAKQDDDDSGE